MTQPPLSPLPAPLPFPSHVEPIVGEFIKRLRADFEAGNGPKSRVILGDADVPAMMELDLPSDWDTSEIADHVRNVAAIQAANLVVLAIDAWSLPTHLMAQREQILARYGSIGASPHRVSAISVLVETPDVHWIGTAPLTKRPRRPKAQTFGTVQFLSTGTTPNSFTLGTLTNLVPRAGRPLQ